MRVWVGRAVGVALLLAAAAAPGGGSAWGKENGREPRAGAESSTSVPPLVIRGVHLEEFGEEGKVIDLWAASAQYSRDEGKLYLQEVRVLGAPKEGKSSQRFELTGDRGTWDMNERVTVVQGDVRISTEDGYVLFTDAARYDYDTREIEGPGPVRVEGPEGLTEGVGLHVRMEDEIVLVREDVRTLIQPTAVKKAKDRYR